MNVSTLTPHKLISATEQVLTYSWTVDRHGNFTTFRHQAGWCVVVGHQDDAGYWRVSRLAQRSDWNPKAPHPDLLPDPTPYRIEAALRLRSLPDLEVES